jgi:hypothetical protein
MKRWEKTLNTKETGGKIKGKLKLNKVNKCKRGKPVGKRAPKEYLIIGGSQAGKKYIFREGYDLE